MDEFLALTAALSALTVLDVELTQRCLAHGICHEGNPLLPESRWKVYVIQIPLTAGASYLGWRLRKGKARYWRGPQVGVATGHGGGSCFGAKINW